MHRRRGRALKGLAAAIGTLVLFVTSIVAGVALHSNTPAGRRLAMTEVNALLRPMFQGHVRIERLESLGLLGLSGADVAIDDPTGQPVLVARGVRVRVATFMAVRSAILGGKAPLTVDLSSVVVDSIDVRLDTDDAGQLELADAFVPGAPSSPGSSSRGGRGFRLEAPRIAWRHARAHGTIPGAPAIDVDVNDLRGAFTYSPEELTLDVTAAAVVARGVAGGADVDGLLEAYVEAPSAPDAPIRARAIWNGIAGGIVHSLRASFADTRIDAVLDAPLIEPANVRAIWSASTIEAPASIHAEVHGPLGGLDFELGASLGPGVVKANGHASIANERTVSMTIDAHDVDVHSVVASVPTTRLGLIGHVAADLKSDGTVSGDATLHFLGGQVGAHAVPPASIQGTGSVSPARQVKAAAGLVIDEPGASTRLDVEVSPKGRSSQIDFDLHASARDLTLIPELKRALQGQLRLSARGSFDAGTKSLEGRVQVAGAGLQHGTTSVASTSLDGRVQGPVDALRADWVLRALGVRAGGLRFDSVYLAAQGDPTAPYVTTSVRSPDIPSVDATAALALVPALAVDALRVSLVRKGEHAIVTARKIQLEGEDLRVDGVRVEGLGAPLLASFTMMQGALHVVASAEGIDLARVARLGDLDKTMKGGTLSFDVDLRLTGDRGEGGVTLDLRNGAFGAAKGVSANTRVTLGPERVSCTLHAEANGIGSLDLSAPRVELARGDLTTAASWRRAWGVIDIATDTDLAKLVAVLPPDEVPLSRAQGKVRVKAHLSRDSANDYTPDLTVSIHTDKLEIAGKTTIARDIDGVLVYPPPAWHVEGVDFDTDAHIDGHTGALQATTRVRDPHGDLGRIELSSQHVPYAEALEGNDTLAARLRTTSFEAHVAVPERGLAGLPPILRQSYVTGRLQADLKASGTLLAPNVDVTAHLRDTSYAASGGTRVPFDVDVTATYDGARGSGQVKARSKDRELLDVDAQVDAAIAQFLVPTDATATPHWKASAHAHLARFPMASIAVLDDRFVSGALSGNVTLTGLHDDARADVSLDVGALTVGSVHYKSANIRLKADGHVIDASLRIDQPDGFLDTKAHATASWGTALAPALEHGHSLDFATSAKNFRIAALLPFVGGTVDELDGRLDADAHVALDPTQNKAVASGTLTLAKGTVEAGAGGGELHDITASAVLSPDGTITLQKLTAKGVTGQLEVTGTAKLDGTSLRSAHAVVVIPNRSAIPLTVSGTEVGNVDGRIEINELTSNDGRAMDVKVQVPQLRVALPEGASADAQALGAMPKVRIGAHRGHPATFVLLPIDPIKAASTPSPGGSSRWTVDAQLGDVQVIRGTELKADLDGRINAIDTGGSPQVTGQIHLKKGGMLDVQGKKFTVEDGTVTMIGAEPSNPEIVVKAGWTAPDGTVVYAVFRGPLKTGKVTLSSEPTLPQQEIVELLLFGTADGTQAQTPSGTPQNTAIGTAGGEAAQPLNHMLGQLGLGAVTANIDTTQSANPRPEVEVQIAKDISVQIAVVLGQPPPGVNPDHTLLTLDWRFLSKWSLASTVGDAGTTIFDLLWQRRY